MRVHQRHLMNENRVKGLTLCIILACKQTEMNHNAVWFNTVKFTQFPGINWNIQKSCTHFFLGAVAAYTSQSLDQDYCSPSALNHLYRLLFCEFSPRRQQACRNKVKACILLLARYHSRAGRNGVICPFPTPGTFIILIVKNRDQKKKALPQAHADCQLALASASVSTAPEHRCHFRLCGFFSSSWII